MRATGAVGPASYVRPPLSPPEKYERLAFTFCRMGTVGLIAWLVNKDADPKVARSMLITGIAISVVVVILVVSAPPSTP